jgi:hypothetical protein
MVSLLHPLIADCQLRFRPQNRQRRMIQHAAAHQEAGDDRYARHDKQRNRQRNRFRREGGVEDESRQSLGGRHGRKYAGQPRQ